MMTKPCRMCDKPFVIKNSRQNFCSKDCAKTFGLIYKNPQEWFELEWTAWRHGFTEKKQASSAEGFHKTS